MSQIRCQVESIAPLTSTVFRVDLTPDVSLDFKSGQYVLVHMGEKDQRPFSIANAAHDNNRLELHIGAEPGNKYAGEVLERARQEKAIYISGGHGEAYLQATDKPIVLIAGGTGFSYAYSILMQSLKEDPNRDITLYWGGRHLDDLYYHDELVSLAAKKSSQQMLQILTPSRGSDRPPSNWQCSGASLFAPLQRAFFFPRPGVMLLLTSNNCKCFGNSDISIR